MRHFLLMFALPILLSAETLTEAEGKAIAIDAYIYSYPLVTMEYTKRVMTNTDKPANDKAPLGQFFNARTYPDASFTAVTTPNADTLYSTAWVDLSKEPYILNVPNEAERYYLMPILSAWTDVFISLGTRTTGTKEASYAITGPSWKGDLPEGLKEIKAPTDLIWILGRTYCTGTKADYDEVHRLQDQYVLFPLRFLGKPYFPPPGQIDPNIDISTPVRQQVNDLPLHDVLDLAAQLMVKNPPSLDDKPALERFAKIGFIPGEKFDLGKLNDKVHAAIDKAQPEALAKIIGHAKEAGKQVNGWLVTLNTGSYGTDYLQRAYIAAIGLGANLPQDALYPMTSQDSKGSPLSGDQQYVIHFDKDKIPPVKGFWSLTMYNKNFFFVENELNRYTLSPRDQLKYNRDGSLDLYIQKEKPDGTKVSNWLPAPEGAFHLVLRLYWPEEAAINGTWTPPAVEKK